MGAMQTVPEQKNELKDERHYTVYEVAEMWSISAKTVRRMFEDYPDVLKIERGGTRKRVGKRLKRTYTSIRIPESVLKRASEEWRNKKK